MKSSVNCMELLAKGIPTTTWENGNSSRYTKLNASLNNTTYFTKTPFSWTLSANSITGKNLIVLLDYAKDTYTSNSYLTGLKPYYTGCYVQAKAFGWGEVRNKIYWGGFYLESSHTSGSNTTYWQTNGCKYEAK